MNFKIISLIVILIQFLKIASKDGIFRRKKSCWTGDSLYSSPKVVPHTNLTNVNTVGENLINTLRSVTTTSDVANEKTFPKLRLSQLKHL
jgi:hypothetical protein